MRSNRALVLTLMMVSVSTCHTVEHHILAKRDPAPFSADRAHEGCTVNKEFHKGQTFTDSKGRTQKCSFKVNEDIQMGECFSNPRILNNVFAIFEPLDISSKSYTSEGGPYGTCTAWNCQPSQDDVQAVDDPRYTCFQWTGRHVVQSGPVATLPGNAFVPPPIVCPSNLDNCYSEEYYVSTGLDALADLVPTYSGIYFSKKVNGKPTYCNCFNCGCDRPTYAQLQSGQ
ncbi:hypothetical protein IE53DRAFT_139363 [Violaceomyces palustris]|uniref:Uncharacterized protein n=1 Tax=Violaceomyces palustris TaxID=1673888 RepID=A0ACD0NUP5_9BASI|nr:hypothetical protein IE53DRAFT_139363 [Violaceomyces palustris]